MYRKLEEIDPEQETLDEVLITLPGCRHIFTVETLDGICEMESFYRRDGPDGHWLGFEDPPTDFRKPPTCPTCRAAITSPRYGRIFKRADLDILENNVASQMSHSLENVREMIQSLSTADIGSVVTREASRTKASHPSLTAKALTSQKRARGAILKDTREIPTPSEALDPANPKFHSVVPSATQAWKRATNQVFRLYTQARQIAETRSAHVNAWEAAFSSLYEQEVNASLEDPAHAPRRPQEHAMRVAKMMVGQPPPRADKRFTVEAFWLTLDLRFTLANVAQIWLDTTSNHQASYTAEQHHIWAYYVGFILATCCRDAQVALDIAAQSGSYRQVVKTKVYCMRADMERFRFNVHMARQKGTLTEDRKTLSALAAQKGNAAEQESLLTVENYLRLKGTRDDKRWLEDNFTNISRKFIEEWSAIEGSLRSGTFYQPVSLEEQMAVVRALSSDFCELSVHSLESALN